MKEVRARSKKQREDIQIQLQEKVSEPFLSISRVFALITPKMWSDLHLSHNSRQIPFQKLVKEMRVEVWVVQVLFPLNKDTKSG